MNQQGDFEAKLRTLGVKKPETGKSFQEYQSAFLELTKGHANAQDQIKIKHLHLAVGGEYRRAKVAYEMLTDHNRQRKDEVSGSQIPAFFESFLASLQQKGSALWPALNEHVERMVAERVQYAEATRKNAQTQLQETEGYLEELSEENASLTQYIQQLEQVRTECAQQEKALIEARLRIESLEEKCKERDLALVERQAQYNELQLQVSQVTALTATLTEKDKQIAVLEEKREMLESDRHQQLIENGRLQEKCEQLEYTLHERGLDHAKLLQEYDKATSEVKRLTDKNNDILHYSDYPPEDDGEIPF